MVTVNLDPADLVPKEPPTRPVRTDDYGRDLGYVPQERLDASNSNNEGDQAVAAPPGKEENLILSRMHTGMEVDKSKWYHRPVLDIDFPARLVPSSTEGHFHLYLDGIAIPHDEYKFFLTVLARMGVISEGYLKYSLDRGYTAVRTPGNFKPKRYQSDDYQPKHMIPSPPSPVDPFADVDMLPANPF